MSINMLQKGLVGYLVFLFIYWILLNQSGEQTSTFNFGYSFLFSLIPLIGGAIGMFGSKTWGTFKSAVGKAVFFISFGLFLWGSGSMIWSFYNFFKDVPAPYPSLADIGFAPSIFFYGLGAIYLSRATGAKFGLKNKFAKIFAILTPFVLLGLSYHFFITVARGGVLIPPDSSLLKTFFDLAYPLGDFVGLVISVIVSGLSFKLLGGKYLHDIIAILLGLAVMTIADAVFSYTTTVGTFYNGNFGDLLLTLGLFLLTFGVFGFNKAKS